MKRDILFIDLTDDFRKYPDSIYTFFKSHYSPLGNKFVAEKIYEKLLSFPETATLFQEKRKAMSAAYNEHRN